MTDYSKMDHQTLYNYVHTGSPDAMNRTAQAWQTHAQDLEQATSELQSNLTAIQSQWQGAAADAYFQQSQTVAGKMQTHADNASNTSTAVTNTASALSWARSNMPDPPSWLEQQTANIDSNFATGALGFLTTDGAATVASEMAKRDIANKHQQAISTMTQLAGAYSSAEAQLPNSVSSGHWEDPNNGNGNGNGSGNGGNPPVMPVPIYPVGGTGGGGGGGGYSGGSGGGHNVGLGPGDGGYPGGGFGSGGGGGSAGGGSGVKVPPYTGPGGDTFTQGAGGSGGTAGGPGSGPGPYTTPGGSSGGYDSGPNPYGGGIGAGALGAGEFGSGGGGGYGGTGGYGSGKYGTGKGGTDLGAGEGSGIGAGEGRGATGGRYGSAAAAAGEEEAAAGGAAGGQGQQGMMGGMGGRGGAGGRGEERGNRAGFLRQDPDYWYGDKQAAPPGGVIE
jgi:WXG100 family type VII secretion target